MKKIIKIITSITLVAAILACTIWYLFVYDRDFTRDLLLSCARSGESNGHHSLAAWFYDLAYMQSDNNDSVAIELSQQYKLSGNYTKAEYTLYNAISDGGGIDVYIALSKLYVEQDKLLDAVTMLNSVTNEQIKQELDVLRPQAPTSAPEPGFYNQYISVALETNNETVYYSTGREYPSAQSKPYSEPITLADGENIISALAVNEQGLVSTLSTIGYTVGGVVELVDFSDPTIEKALRVAINADEATDVYTNDLWTITEFTVPKEAKDYSDIKHLAFLKKLTITSANPEELKKVLGLTNLTELSITDTAISQDVLEQISKLPFINKLTLSNCNLSGIAPLANLTTLTELDLSNNTIRNISAISALNALQKLDLQHNALSDLSPVSSLSALTELNVSHNSLTTLAPVATLTALVKLDASTNNLSELGDFSKLTTLTELSLASNKLASVDPISPCTALTDLDISSNLLENIQSLSSLSKLVNFNFSHNTVSELPKFTKDCALVNIDGSYNTLKKLDSLSGLKMLNIVNMDYNEAIKSIDCLIDCPKLLIVNVYGTAVTDAKKLTSQSIVVNYNPVQ